MSGVRIQGSTSGNVAEVTANQEIQVRPTLTAANAGYVKIADLNGNPLQLEKEGRLDAAVEHLLMVDQVALSNLDYRLWGSYLTTYTITTTAGYYHINNGASTAQNASGLFTTWQKFVVQKEGAIYLKMTCNPVNGGTTNKTMELGFGYNNNTALVDGACFRWGGGTTFNCILSNASAEQTTSVTMPTADVFHAFKIKLTADDCIFYIDNVVVATMLISTTLAATVGNMRLPAFARVYTVGATPALAPQLKIGPTAVSQKIFQLQRPYSALQAGLARHVSMSPVTAFAQTATHANSTDPTSATLANTGIGAYTTLGGRYQFAAVNGAVTDYVMFVYLVPTNWRLFVTGVRISAMNTGATVTGTATILDWSLGVNGTALDLSTADSLAAGTFATRRIPIGMHGFPVTTSIIGTSAPDVVADFSACPLMVESARYFHVIMECPVGTNTGSEIFRGDCQIQGWFE
jgi:hypothetical protein